jgi:N-acetylglutamate synthase-like GNAT family acetyltransferase
LNPVLRNIKIRTDLLPGDIGCITAQHGRIYSEEFKYGISFEAIVAAGMTEFVQQYNNSNCVWICEHNNKMIGSLILMNRGNNIAQLRFFLIEKKYRSIGLGNKLMQLYMEFFQNHNYTSSYLWTTADLQNAAHLYIKYGFYLTEENITTRFGKELTEQKYVMVI